MSRCRSLFFPALTALGVAVAVFGAPANASAGFNLSFASVDGASITFNAKDPGAGFTGSFQFNPQGSNTFQITNGGGPLLNGLQGTVTGTYNIGSISTIGPVETAAVSLGAGGPHQFVIDDGNGFSFTANINWIDISTFGALGGLNAMAQINLTALTYGGSNAALKNLVTENALSGASVTATFQFGAPTSLTQLTQNLEPGNPDRLTSSESFSGTLTAPNGGPLPTPAPAGLVLMASGLPFLLVGRAFRRRANREESTLVV